MAALTVAIDFDGVLVNDGHWIPGAIDAIHELWRRDALVIVHSCRANSPDGLALLHRTLVDLGVPPVGPRGGRRLHIHAEQGKPQADVYIDDKAIRFTGNWHTTLAELNFRAWMHG